jgi:hypothetical protein
MMKAMALWEELAWPGPFLSESRMANRRTLLLPGVPLWLISSFADYETCRRRFKIKKVVINSESNEFFRVPALKSIKPTISRTTKYYDQ